MSRPRQYERSPVVIWTTADGMPLQLSEMEDSHLQNTVAYLTRRDFEWQHVEARARAQRLTIAPLRINNRTPAEWIELMLAELDARNRINKLAVLRRTPPKYRVDPRDRFGQRHDGFEFR